MFNMHLYEHKIVFLPDKIIEPKKHSITDFQ